MTIEEFKRKYKDKIRRGYEELHAQDPYEYMGAKKISLRLGIPEKDCDSLMPGEAPQWRNTHQTLHELKKEGILEQKFNYGFRLKVESPSDMIEYRIEKIKKIKDIGYSSLPFVVSNDCCKETLKKSYEWERKFLMALFDKL